MEIVNIFLKNTYSINQARKRLQLLRVHLSELFFNQKAQDISQEDLSWLKSLGEAFYKNFNKLNVYQQLGILEKQVNSLQVLTIYISFDMPDQQTDELGKWLRINIKPDLFFEIKHDGNLIAGSALSWQGTYKDYSIRTSIEGNKGAILASFKSFLK